MRAAVAAALAGLPAAASGAACAGAPLHAAAYFNALPYDSAPLPAAAGGAAGCCTRCAAAPGTCAAWTFDNRTASPKCHLFGALPAAVVASAACVSGVTAPPTPPPAPPPPQATCAVTGGRCYDAKPFRQQQMRGGGDGCCSFCRTSAGCVAWDWQASGAGGGGGVGACRLFDHIALQRDHAACVCMYSSQPARWSCDHASRTCSAGSLTGHSKRVTCEAACGTTTPAPPATPAPGPPRYHCLGASLNYTCIVHQQGSGHSTMETCVAACQPPTPEPPTPPPPPPMSGVACDPAMMNWDSVSLFAGQPILTVPVGQLHFNRTENETVESTCCEYCVLDSRCKAWTVQAGDACRLYDSRPLAQVPRAGAISGNPFPRIPDIPYDAEGRPDCLGPYAARGPYAVRRYLTTKSGGTAESDQCTPCGAPEPKDASYLIIAPDIGGLASWPRMPVYIFIPAEGQMPGKYGGALEEVASHGFIVLSPLIDHTQCHSNVCDAEDGLATIFRNHTGPPPDTACATEQERRGLDSVDLALRMLDEPAALLQPGNPSGIVIPQWLWALIAVPTISGAVGPAAPLPIAVGGASATAPAALKAAAHLSASAHPERAARVAAVVMQHPSVMPSHSVALNHSFDVYAERAASGAPLPAVLVLAGSACDALGGADGCAPLLYDKQCRHAAQGMGHAPKHFLLDCGDCSSSSGTRVAWSEYAERYTDATAAAPGGGATTISVAGPWHHWSPQSTGEVPMRRGCGGKDLLPETPFVVAFLRGVLLGEAEGLLQIANCSDSVTSLGAEAWIVPRLEETRLALTKAGRLVQKALNDSKHPDELHVKECGIHRGRINQRISVNITGRAATAPPSAASHRDGTGPSTAAPGYIVPGEPGPAPAPGAPGAGLGLPAAVGAGVVAAAALISMAIVRRRRG